MQAFEKINATIRQAYLEARQENPAAFKDRLNLSWSNWGFGIEPLAASAARLAKAGITFIELHGNHYGPDLGYKPKETLAVLSDHGIRVAGICGMYSPDSELSSPRGAVRQRAIDYIRRSLTFAAAVKASYLLIAPAAVGRPNKLDEQEFHRSVETLRLVADEFTRTGIRGAVEPIRAAEVSLCHTFDDAEAYIRAVDHPGIRHINGDIYHMLVGESHIAQRVWKAGDKLINLHMADTNRCALGKGMMDLDTLLMALYLIRYNRPGCYCTPEPLGPGGDPYPAMFSLTSPKLLNALVNDTAKTFRQREDAVRALEPAAQPEPAGKKPKDKRPSKK